MTPQFETPFRVIVAVLACGVLFPIAGYLIRMSLRDFLARRVFAARTIMLFSPDAIWFCSRLYARPVVIWRTWNSQPVRARFILQQDTDASAYAEGVGQKRKAPKDHLHGACILEIVMTTVNRRSHVGFEGQGTILRSIPVTEVSLRLATRFTMVYAAAAALTSPVQNPAAPKSTVGTDIDSA